MKALHSIPDLDGAPLPEVPPAPELEEEVM